MSKVWHYNENVALEGIRIHALHGHKVAMIMSINLRIFYHIYFKVQKLSTDLSHAKLIKVLITRGLICDENMLPDTQICAVCGAWRNTLWGNRDGGKSERLTDTVTLIVRTAWSVVVCEIEKHDWSTLAQSLPVNRLEIANDIETVVNRQECWKSAEFVHRVVVNHFFYDEVSTHVLCEIWITILASREHFQHNQETVVDLPCVVQTCLQ